MNAHAHDEWRAAFSMIVVIPVLIPVCCFSGQAIGETLERGQSEMGRIEVDLEAWAGRMATR